MGFWVFGCAGCDEGRHSPVVLLFHGQVCFMGNMRKKHLKSGTTKASAILVSFVIHAVLAVVALFFVAVSVVVKGETEFVAKPVERPNMQLRKLQVPVNVKSTPRPKLRRQIVAAPKINHSIAIQLPEIVGVAGGIGSGRSGLGGGASLGFTMPEIEFFGVKSQGERLFFVLDASDHMMVDEIGGVRSYEIIKAELIRILRELNSVVLFNVAVYEDYSAKMIFPQMVPASSENVDQAVEWLEPLNSFTTDRSTQQQYGAKTTGQGGSGISQGAQVEPLKGGVSHWATPAMESMRERAESVFILSSGWGFIAYKTGDASGWGQSEENRFQKKLAEAKTKLVEENERRKNKGEPPRIIPSVNYERNLVHAYFPDEPVPPYDQYEQYSTRDLLAAFLNTRTVAEKGSSRMPKLRKKKAGTDFAINVIHFSKVGSEKEQRFMELTSLSGGEYRMIEGLESVESYVK